MTPMPTRMLRVSGDFSRVFLDVVTGDAIVSVSADGKTVSKFYYLFLHDALPIYQYAQATALLPMPTTMPSVSGDFSRVFLDVVTGDAKGRRADDWTPVTRSHRDASSEWD